MPPLGFEIHHEYAEKQTAPETEKAWAVEVDAINGVGRIMRHARDARPRTTLRSVFRPSWNQGVQSKKAYYEDPNLRSGTRIAAWLQENDPHAPFGLCLQVESQEGEEWVADGEPEVMVTLPKPYEGLDITFTDVNTENLEPPEHLRLVTDLYDTIKLIAAANEVELSA